MDNDLQEMIKAMKETKTGVKKFWSPPTDKEGSFPIRILPPNKERGEKVFYHQHKVHWINQRAYECLKQTTVDKDGNKHEQEECPVCKFVSKLYDGAVRDSDEWKLAGQLRAQDRYIYRVIVRGREDEEKPEFYESGKSIFEILFHIIAETDYGNITHLKEGRDFILSKKGTGRLSKYETSTPSANASPIFADKTKIAKFVEYWNAMDYNVLYERTTAEAMRAALKQSIDGTTDDEPVADKPTKPVKQNEKAVIGKTPDPSMFADDEDEVKETASDDDIDDILNSL